LDDWREFREEKEAIFIEAYFTRHSFNGMHIPVYRLQLYTGDHLKGTQCQPIYLYPEGGK
jgi:hypothetical protein